MITAAALIHSGRLALHAGFGIVSIPQVITVILSILILIGLWTPVAGTLVALVEMWIAFSLCGQSGEPWASLILASIAAALAMLGPGAHSMDAKLFGRKHIDLRQ